VRPFVPIVFDARLGALPRQEVDDRELKPRDMIATARARLGADGADADRAERRG
jgi:hypothetical protein